MDSTPRQEGVLRKFWGFSGLSWSTWDQKLILPPEQYAYWSATIKDGKFNEDLNKLFWSHPKDFAVRQKLAEIFIVRVISRVKLPILRAWPIFEHFKTLKPTLAKHDSLSKKIKTSESETTLLVEMHLAKVF